MRATAFFLFFSYTWLKKQKFSIFFCALNSVKWFSVCIKFNFIKLADFEGHLMVSDMNEILRFPCKLSCQNADYVKLNNIKI